MVKIAFPIEGNLTRDDTPHGHFGRAPKFYIVNDLDDSSKDEIINNDSDHFGGTLSPPDFLAEKGIEVVITGGMGRKAIEKFMGHNIVVYQAGGHSIGNLLEMLKNKELKDIEGCTHDHAHGHH